MLTHTCTCMVLLGQYLTPPFTAGLLLVSADEFSLAQSLFAALHYMSLSSWGFNLETSR